MASVIKLRVNGVVHEISVAPQTSLLSVLRDRLELTGTKYGCGEAQCGACTVLIDGSPRRSCVTAVGTVINRSITTIEGLEHHGRLHPVQEAFLEEEALQCGYCTPGMIMSAVAFLKSNPNPTEPEIARAMEGNICRCGTYPRIVAAIQRAARKRGES
jgi:isoquinoline 1-oxidoreductase subunit alpha